MGLNDIGDGEGDILDELRNYTVAELEAEYGSEAVRRGLQYMLSLKKADEEYRQSADPEDLDRGWARAYNLDEEEVETEASENWVEGMEEGGLGLDE